ncbi:phosphoglycolate phosphatase [Rhizomicrobium palustre]|uniref:Phosphoglycolate phosphatase n=1 Tax=Rhizomicrobium palustre TaxID=189966 RepID=A0A846MZB2_9PROT|nr:HAD hydrolase-like protein [Rhizomicrobium palustre]NIK88589.1 phosphoglycolate phosphatase [Rhizomicrobium palustre]
MSDDTPTVLLDLDGTLIDSEPGILSSCKVALATLGHELDLTQDFSGIIGPPIEVIMGTLLKPFGDDRIAEAVKAYRAEYSVRGLFQSPPYPGIETALTTLRQSGARLFLATGKRVQFAKRILEHLGLTHFFEEMYGSVDDGSLDHKPELLAHIIARHDLKPAHCVMVGDRRYDILGAKANDMRSLGALWGYGSRDELTSAGADGLITATAELPEAAMKMAQA